MTEHVIHDEVRNETYIPPEIEREMESEEESRAIIRDFVYGNYVRGRNIYVDEFLAANNTESVRWDYNAVESEIVRVVTELESLRKDIRDYVKDGGWYAYCFSATYPKYKNVPGRVIQQMIDTEREALKDGNIS